MRNLAQITRLPTNCSSVLNAIVLEFGGMGSLSVVTGYESLLLCTLCIWPVPYSSAVDTRFDNAQKLSKACGPECCSVKMLATDRQAKN